MRKIFISALLLCGCATGFAQQMNVSSVEKVNLPEGTLAGQAPISPTGQFIVVSDMMKDGLKTYDLTTGEVKTITDASGIGSNVQISADGSTIVYRESKLGKDHLRRTNLKSVNLTNGEQKTIVKESRDLQGYAVKDNAVAAVNKGKFKASAAQAKTAPVASISKGQLLVTVDGKTTTISPNGTTGQSYLWPSVSPDGTKVLYYLATVGAYTCNIDGSNPQFIGALRAAKWYNNSIVVGMKDADNGQFVTSSTVYAASIDGKEMQALTDESVMAMYPSASADGSKIAFSTPQGEAYIINVK